MKSMITKILLLSFLFLPFIPYSYGSDGNGLIKTRVSIDLSGLLPKNSNTEKIGYCVTEIEEKTKTEKFFCYTSKNFNTIELLLGKMIQYFTYIAALGAVLFIVINGILYSMGGADQGLKDESKKRIIQTLIGLIVLLLSGVILNTIAPWVYQL